MNLQRKWLVSGALAIGVIAAGATLNTREGKAWLVSQTITESTLRHFPEPGLTQWRPQGPREVGTGESSAAQPVTFARAMHTDLRGSDEVTTVAAPMFEAAWTAETNLFVGEGPVFDSEGQVYICPNFGPEPYLLVAMDKDTGERRWAIPGESAGAGAPIILTDENGVDTIYLGAYDRAMALTTDGKVLWDVATGLTAPDELDARNHSFGVNYHPQTDSIVVVLGDGHIYALDRETGKQLLQKPFLMPGAPTAVTNFSLPEDITERANRDIAHMVPSTLKDQDFVGGVLHVAAGELQKVTNFFSIDGNSGRIWVASTLPDEEDGKRDGWSDYAGLFGLDLKQTLQGYELSIAVTSQVPGGTASTPTVSADGSRVYIADAFHSVYAVDANSGEKIWSFDVEQKVAGSLVVSADNGEVYANTRTKIKKLFDRGDYAELAWVANLDMYHTGRFQKNIKALGAELTANGIAFTGAAGVVAGKQKFPLKLGAGLIDRETGDIRYFAEGAEDSVSSMVTAPDGSIYVGNSPLRRVLGRASFGEHVSPQPVLGGVTRFKPVNYHLLIRDALWAAATRLDNVASQSLVNPAVVKADVQQTQQLLQQVLQVLPQTRDEQLLSTDQLASVEKRVHDWLEMLSENSNNLKTIAQQMQDSLSLVQISH